MKLLPQCFLFFQCCIADLMLLKNRDSVVCLSEKPEVQIYLSPVIEEGEEKLTLGNWINDDWNSSFSDFKNEKKFQDLPTQKSKIVEFNSPRSFWIFGASNFSVHIRPNDGMPRTMHIPGVVRNTSRWYNYTIKRKNKKIEIYEGNKSIYIWKNIPKGPVKFLIINEKITYWKAEDKNLVKYRWSKNVTTGKSTTFQDFSSDLTCLTVHYKLCAKCYLEVTSGNVSYNLVSNNSSVWQKKDIRLGSKEINFSRRMSDIDDGFWGLRIDICHDNNIVKRRAQPGVEYSCHYLDESEVIYSSGSRDGKFLCKEPGKLGARCDKTCSAILDPKYSKCENFEICQNGGCSCAWGFYGNDCKKNCEDGSWGPNCRNRCENCDDCHKKTGNCTNSGRTYAATVTIIIIIILVVLLIVSLRSHFDQITGPVSKICNEL